MNKHEQLMKELQVAVYDPNIIQIKSLKLLQAQLNGECNIPDATNPFIFLMENNAMVTSAAVHETAVNFRRTYPELATSKTDLYGHINTNEVNNIFAGPSKAMFNIYLGADEIMKFGKITGTFSSIIVPKFSNITVDEITFTLLNDLQIYLYSNGKTFAKYTYNNIEIGVNTDNILKSTLVSDKNGKKWLMVELEIQQLKRYTFRETLMNSVPFNTTFNLGDDERFTYIETRSLNKQTSEVIRLHTTFSQFVYNPDVPTMIIKPDNNKINLELPVTYTLNKLISSFIDVELFTTLGKRIIPLNKYDTLDYVFKVVLPNTTDESIIGINNIPIKVNSNSYTYGGQDEITFKSLKNKVMNYATGDNNLPITTHEIKSRVEEYGYKFKRINTSILKSEVLITKDIGALDYDLKTNLTLISGDITIKPADVTSSKIHIISSTKLSIEPFQLFKNVNGTTIPLNDVERIKVTEDAKSNISEYNKQKIYFNLYKYVLDYSSLVNVRVYDVNQPTLNNATTLYNSSELYTPFVITKRNLVNVGGNYKIIYNIVPNSEIDKLDLDKLFVQLYIPLGTNEKIYFKGTFHRTETDLVMTINLKLSYYIDKDNKTMISTDVGVIRNAYIDIIAQGNITIYSVDQAMVTSSNINPPEVVIDESTFVVYSEHFNLTFAKSLEHLFVSYALEYTDRKFKTYDKDVYKTYDADVYETDETGTIKITKTNDNDVIFNILHKKGDVMMYSDKPIIVHKKGDIMLDSDMMPIVDHILGISHKLNILLMEDHFLRTTNDIYKRYRIDYFIRLTDIITKELEPIDKELLDNTAIKFSPNVSLSDVYIETNGEIKSYTNQISPTINIYLGNETSLEVTDELGKRLYNYLQSRLYENVTIRSIEDGLTKLIDTDILTIKLTDVTPDNNLNILNYTMESSKFIINKTLTFLEDSTLIVKPELKINLITI